MKGPACQAPASVDVFPNPAGLHQTKTKVHQLAMSTGAQGCAVVGYCHLKR